MNGTAMAGAVGVVGLGAMGMGTARALLDAGFDVIGCDTDPGACEAFASGGGRVAATPADAAGEASVLITLVVNREQVERVLFGPDGAVSALAGRGLVLQCATVPPSYARELEERLAASDVALLDAPVSGGAARAREGRLSVMASGSAPAFDRAAAVLEAIAETVHRLGDVAGAGSSVKLVNQLLAGVHIAAAAEAMALGIRMGLDPDALYRVITASAGSSWMFENRVPHMLEGDYTPRSAVDIFVKDLGIVADTGRELTFPLPVTAAALQQFAAASAAGHGREDDMAVVKVFRHVAGIELPEAEAD